MRLKKVVFLDRDGTINVDRGYVYRREEWEWIPGAVDALKQLVVAGFKLAVVSNQSGIGHGLYTVSDVRALHTFMQQELAAQGIVLAAVVFCPHQRGRGCRCRKPAVGMARQAERLLGAVDYAASWAVGDKVADAEFGKNLGTHTALIRGAYWQEATLLEKPDLVVGSLHEAAHGIVSWQRKTITERMMAPSQRID